MLKFDYNNQSFVIEHDLSTIDIQNISAILKPEILSDEFNRNIVALLGDTECKVLHAVKKVLLTPFLSSNLNYTTVDLIDFFRAYLINYPVKKSSTEDIIISAPSKILYNGTDSAESITFLWSLLIISLQITDVIFVIYQQQYASHHRAKSILDIGVRFLRNPSLENHLLKIGIYSKKYKNEHFSILNLYNEDNSKLPYKVFEMDMELKSRICRAI